jgi:hypothetical protein
MRLSEINGLGVLKIAVQEVYILRFLIEPYLFRLSESSALGM